LNQSSIKGRTVQAIIADAGPLIALARINRLKLLHSLYGKVIVPSVVWLEMTSAGAFGDIKAIQFAQTKAWLEIAVEELNLNVDPASPLWIIDAGERAAITLALEFQQNGTEPLLILDDAAARASAKIFSLPMIGTLGVLMRAKSLGFLTAVIPLVVELRNSGYFFSEALISSVAERTGESMPS
jgi:predicted nucleic acid-binding protein